jgi:Zn finger protein HypA/HybF involved in hydrogenase expression
VHDYHAVEALIERLTGEFDDLELERVAEVRIRASPVFSPEALEQAYEMLTRETPLESSRLVVEELPDERTCPSCGGSWLVSRDDLAGHLLVCPSCGTLSTIEGGSGIEVVGVIGADAAEAGS